MSSLDWTSLTSQSETEEESAERPLEREVTAWVAFFPATSLAKSCSNQLISELSLFLSIRVSGDIWLTFSSMSALATSLTHVEGLASVIFRSLNISVTTYHWIRHVRKVIYAFFK